MTCIIDTKLKRRLPARLAAGLAISAFLVLGTVASAGAEDHRGGGYDGGYYRAPPIVRLAALLCAAGGCYGPGVGTALPGIGFW